MARNTKYYCERVCSKPILNDEMGTRNYGDTEYRIYKCFYFAYPRKPFELCLKALVEVPIHNNREYIFHGLSAEGINWNNVEMAKKPSSDLISTSTWWTHGGHKQLINKLQYWSVFPEIKQKKD